MLLASCGSDIKFHRWPSGDYHATFQLPEAGLSVPSISWCCEGELLAATVPSLGPPVLLSVGQTVLKLATIDLLQIQALSFSTSVQENLILGSANGHVLLYDVGTKGVVHQLPMLPAGVKHLCFGAKDASLAAGCKNAFVYLYNSRNAVCATFCVPNSNSLSALRTHAHRAHILGAASGEGVVAVWDSSTGDTKLLEKAHGTAVSDMDFSSGDDVVTVGLDQKLNGYDLRSKGRVFSSTADSKLSAVGCMANKIAVASVDGKLYSYDRRRISYPMHTIVAHHPKTIGRIAFQTCTDAEEAKLIVCNRQYSRIWSSVLGSAESVNRGCSTVGTVDQDLQGNARTPASGDYSPGLNNKLGVVENCGRMSYDPVHHVDKKPSVGRNPGQTNFLAYADGFDAANLFDIGTKTEVIASWIKKLPCAPDRSNLTNVLIESDDNVVEELRRRVGDVFDKLVDAINKEFLRVRMDVSKGFIGMEYKINSKWEEFNSSLAQLAGDERVLEEDFDKGDASPHAEVPSRIPRRHLP